jgi:hypothetical protein
MTVLSTVDLQATCDSALKLLDAGNATTEQQKEAAFHLRERIRVLLNTCTAGFEGRLISGKWKYDGDEYDTYDDYLAQRQSDR